MTEKKNLYSMIFIICSSLLLGCKDQETYPNITHIHSSPTTAKPANVSEVFEFSFANITLPDSVFFGNIDHIKADDKQLYLFDPSKTRTITILDKRGNYVNQLKRIGNGPGEYTSPFAFDVDTNNDELLVYDRSRLYINTYELPSLALLGTQRVDSYLMNFEILDKKKILAVRDDTKDQNRLFGLEIWNRDFEVVKDEISDMHNAVIELSYPSSIGRSESGVLYAHPFTGLISSVGESGLTPHLKLNFSRWEIPKNLYSMEDAIPFERALRENKYMLWPRFPLHINNTFSMWYMFGSDVENYQLLVHDLSTGKQKNYSEIRLDNSGLKLPMPLGLDNDSYVTLIWPKDIAQKHISAEYADVFEKSRTTELPIIVFLKIK